MSEDPLEDRGADWFWSLAVVVALVVGLLPTLVALVFGTDAIVWLGISFLLIGSVAFAFYLTPWLEREWPLDGKDGWLIASSFLVPAGVVTLAVGVLVRA